MTLHSPTNGNGGLAATEEWVFTLTGGLVTRIERVDTTTQMRSELSADEYAALAGGYYTAYYSGIRDYATAIASGNADVALRTRDVSVSCVPGMMQFTRMPKRASSIAADLVKWITPAFAAP